MSDAQEWQAAPAAPADGITAGTLLRRARESAGLHVAALAVSLKVPAKKLEALEADRWDEMPDTVFVRALAASVCRVLKIDPQPIMERLPQGARPRLVPASDGINAPFRPPSHGAPPRWVDQLTRPVFLAVFALLLGALVLILLPVARSTAPGAGTANVPSVPRTAPANPSTAAAAPNMVTQAVQPATMAATPAQAAGSAAVLAAAQPPQGAIPAPAAPGAATTSASSTIVPAGSTAPTAAAIASPQPVASPAPGAAAAAAAPPVPASSVVVITAKGASWVEVMDAQGNIAVRKNLGPGENAAASGAMPLKVTIGRADAVDVQVRGKPLDLRGVSRDNVARFEVK